MITAVSNVYLLENAKVDYQKQNGFLFSSYDEEVSYFLGCAKYSFANCSIVEEDRTIILPLDDLHTLSGYYSCNYLMYQNPAFSNKWFFAYIGKPTPRNGGTCAMPFEVDYWQTWHNEAVFPQTMVERETVGDDTRGANLIPENLETGEFVISEDDYNDGLYSAIGTDIIKESGWDTRPAVLIGYLYQPKKQTGEEDTSGNYIVEALQEAADKLTYNFPNLAPVFAGGRFQQGNFQACKYVGYLIKTDTQEELDAAIDVVNSVMTELLTNVMIETVQVVKMVPYFIIANSREGDKNTATPAIHQVVGKGSPATFGGYTPKNQKLYTQPFNYVVMDNGAGETVEFGYEYFKGDSTQNIKPGTPTFRLYSQLSNNPSCRLIPFSYKGPSRRENPLYSMKIDSFPNCSYSFSAGALDYYKNQSQYKMQGGSAALSAASGFIGSVMSFATGDFEGGVSGLANTTTGVLQTMAKSKDAARIPNTVQSSTDDSMQFAIGRMTFTEYRMQIRRDYAERIDNFFTAYGYAVNNIKAPELFTRVRFNFIKTGGCNVQGNMPTEAKGAINALFNNGFRVWHAPEYWLDYSSNPIIGG